jgi:RNA polymerase sigma-70 factor (ECF subfamily)
MNLERLSNEELVNCMNNGQKEAAFNVLYKRHYNSVYGFCLKSSKDREVSEDLTQDTFFKLLENSNKFVKNKYLNLKSWLYTVAHNNFINYLRKKSTCKEFLFSEVFADKIERNEQWINAQFKLLMRDVSPIESDIFDEEKYSYLKRVMESLKQENLTLFKVIDLRYFKELSYKEIIQETGFSLPKVKSSLYSAKRVLKKKLSGMQGFLL